MFKFIKNFLQRHADAGTLTNTTGNYVNSYTGDVTPFSGIYDLSAGMKTYYNTALLENARANLVHAQFGRKQGLPANNGKVIEWRKWNTLPKALKPLTEGVIPTGQKFGETSMTTGLTQHGMYVSVSDLLDLHHVDPVISGATEELGASAGETEDTLVRNGLLAGTNVLYCDYIDADTGKITGTPYFRKDLHSGNCKLTVDMVKKARTKLKKLKAPTINGKYVAVIHPSVSYDLTSDPNWVESHKYAAVEEIFAGEIGEIDGVRFVETTEAGIYVGTPLNGTNRYLSVSAYDSASHTDSGVIGVATNYRLTVSETITDALIGRLVLIQDHSDSDKEVYGAYSIAGVNTTSNYVYLKEEPGLTPASGDFLLPGEGGLEAHEGTFADTNLDEQCAVYCTLFLGKDAFGVIDPAGGGLQMIVKTKEQIGGPLNQFSTIGYKFEFGMKILYEDRMVRVESCSTYSDVDEANDTIIL